MLKHLPLLVLAICLAGCSTSKVIRTSQDTFMVTSSGAGFGTAGVRENVFNAANDYASKQGLVMVPVSFKAKAGELGRNPPSADLIFKLVKPGDPSIGQTSLTEAEQVQVKQDIQIRSSTDNTKDQDVYTELLKLDDLRKRGILTEAEFEAAKARLLAKQGK